MPASQTSAQEAPPHPPQGWILILYSLFRSPRLEGKIFERLPYTGETLFSAPPQTWNYHICPHRATTNWKGQRKLKEMLCCTM
jgi:hypothetical protein